MYAFVCFPSRKTCVCVSLLAPTITNAAPIQRQIPSLGRFPRVQGYLFVCMKLVWVCKDMGVCVCVCVMFSLAATASVCCSQVNKC